MAAEDKVRQARQLLEEMGRLDLLAASALPEARPARSSAAGKEVQTLDLPMEEGANGDTVPGVGWLWGGTSYMGTEPIPAGQEPGSFSVEGAHEQCTKVLGRKGPTSSLVAAM
ncbi:hypothetical protein NDU88_001032 [Pleurodeles waltl]|uniref:Uncharacterized protein n=1 Tax=Pleurodeles waltl TaxID=8319 RepID=A0AAV7MIL3_PLEWA|nr:hypothetical protein NDU88_001032 [Pleurodeles waltl]